MASFIKTWKLIGDPKVLSTVGFAYGVLYNYDTKLTNKNRSHDRHDSTTDWLDLFNDPFKSMTDRLSYGALYGTVGYIVSNALIPQIRPIYPIMVTTLYMRDSLQDIGFGMMNEMKRETDYNTENIDCGMENTMSSDMEDCP